MNRYTFLSNSPKATFNFGKRVGEGLEPGSVIALTGELGCGKTLFTRGIGAGLGVPDRYVNSPTFVFANEYSGRLPVSHIDLYRLDHIEEIAELGLDDYLYGNGVCVVEWAEKGLSLLPIEHLLIQISYLSDNERSFQLKPNGKRYREILAQLKHPSLNS